MTNNSIHPDATVETVHLTVADLARELAFYERGLGLELIGRDGATARLGAGGREILVLRENPQAPRAPGTTGLYHFAVLVPSRLDLARSLRRLSETETPVEGFADHLVSEAIYLADPEGNGIEIYRDRPRSDWFDARGRFRMGTEPLDLKGVMAELEGHPEATEKVAAATRLGHIHLRVSDIRSAREFYGDVLGFGVMASWGSAGFVSAGGYHHHIGFNTWGTAGAPPPPAGALGLEYFTIQLPTAEALGQVLDRLSRAGIAVEERNEGVLVRDPSQNGVMLRAEGPAEGQRSAEVVRTKEN